MLNDVLRRFTHTKQELSDMEKRRKANGGKLKPSDRAVSKAAADFLLNAQVPLDHLNLRERNEAVREWKARNARMRETPTAADIAIGGLRGVTDADLATYAAAVDLVQRERDDPEAFLCRPIASAYGRMVRSNSSRGEGSSDGYYYNHAEIRATANRMKWRDHKPKSKRRAEIMAAIIEEQKLHNTASVKRNIRRILHTL